MAAGSRVLVLLVTAVLLVRAVLSSRQHFLQEPDNLTVLAGAKVGPTLIIFIVIVLLSTECSSRQKLNYKARVVSLHCTVVAECW